jgi:hypothetical protein
VDVSLCAYLQEGWLDGLNSAREEIKRHDKRAVEAESARMKYLALKRLTKKEVGGGWGWGWCVCVCVEGRGWWKVG